MACKWKNHTAMIDAKCHRGSLEALQISQNATPRIWQKIAQKSNRIFGLYFDIVCRSKTKFTLFFASYRWRFNQKGPLHFWRQETAKRTPSRCYICLVWTPTLIFLPVLNNLWQIPESRLQRCRVCLVWSILQGFIKIKLKSEVWRS